MHEQLTFPEAAKRCSACGLLKALDEFHRDRTGKDDLSYHCKNCAIARARAWYATNRARAAERERRKRMADGEAGLAQRRKRWRAKADRINAAWRARLRAEKAALGRRCAECGEPLAPEKSMQARFCSTVCQVKNRHREWKRQNPDRIRASFHRRRARLREAFVEDVIAFEIFERDEWLCGICGESVGPEDASIDHVIPLAKGGAHEAANCQLAHTVCNSRKRTAMPTPEELAAFRSRIAA